MPEKDCRTIEKTLSLICNEFADSVISVCELGVHQGNTSRGMRSYLNSLGREISHTGIDNQRDFKMGAPFPESRFIIGNTIEVYNQVENDSQHFLFIDACHNYPMTMADFLVYSDKIKEGGYVAFHDTGAQIKPMTDFQGMGDMDDPDMWIACRKAVNTLGLLNNKFEGWTLIFDEYDENFHTGGIVVVQKNKIHEYYETLMSQQ